MKIKSKFKLFATVLVGVLLTAATQIPKTQRVYAASAWDTPASVIKIDETNIGELIDSRADGQTVITDNDGEYKAKRETYTPSDRQWQGLPSVAVTGNRIWTCWYTGGTGEPRKFNYIVVAYSDDNGASWVDPFLVVDCKTTSQENAGVSDCVCNFFVDEDGKLYLLYMQSKTWAVEFLSPDAENISDVTFSEPYVLTKAKLHKPPTLFKDEDGKTAWGVAYESTSTEKEVSTTYFAVSKDKGQTWEVRGKVQGSVPSARKYPESQAVELSDGKLMILSRIEGGQAGGVEITKSDDFGKTWSTYENNLEEPFIGPGSKGHAVRLSSGNVLIVNHDTKTERGGLTAYLSKDGGKTYPYKLAIDPRSGDVQTGCSYPFVFEKSGKIYVVWDYGRYVQKEIRLSVFTETDVENGYYGEAARYKIAVSKLNTDYKEIVEIKTELKTRLTYAVGTDSAEVRKDLPTTLTVLDNDGKEYTLSGTWKSAGYKKDTAGVYTFTFVPSGLTSTVEDCAERLTVRVELTEQQKSGCFGNVQTRCFGALAIPLLFVWKKRKVS